MEYWESPPRNGQNFSKPLRNCSFETLKFVKWTWQSDVWSFGVFLWEIFMLGQGTPYLQNLPHYLNQPPGIPFPDQLVQFLENGGRLERPPLCPVEIYVKMLRCWDIDPRCRMTFETLQFEFRRLQGYGPKDFNLEESFTSLYFTPYTFDQ